MNSFLSFFNLERLFGFVVYNLMLAGLIGLYIMFNVAVMGNEIVWSGPQLYSYEDKLPASNKNVRR